MPKKIKPPPLKEDRTLTENIIHLCDMRGIGRSKLLSIIGCSNATFCTKMAEPERFTLRDLKRVAKFFNIPVSKLLSERKWST